MTTHHHRVGKGAAAGYTDSKSCKEEPLTAGVSRAQVIDQLSGLSRKSNYKSTVPIEFAAGVHASILENGSFSKSL